MKDIRTDDFDMLLQQHVHNDNDDDAGSDVNEDLYNDTPMQLPV